MTTAAEILTRKNLQIMFVCRFSGINYFFSNREAPARWLTGSKVTFESEDYRWSPTLTVPSDWASIDQRLQPKGGVGTSGALNFTMRVDGYDSHGYDDAFWNHLMVRAKIRDDESLSTSLNAQLTADDEGPLASITVLSNEWLGGPQPIIHVGIEAINVPLQSLPTATATSIAPIDKRGAWGSQRYAHQDIAITGGESMASGELVTDWPIAWEGRYAELWLVPGEETDDGVFVPYAELLEGEENLKIHAGVITDTLEGGDFQSVTIETASLETILDQEVCQRFPEGKAGLPESNFEISGKVRQVYIDSHNDNFLFTLKGAGSNFGRTFIQCKDPTNIIDNDTFTFTLGATVETYTAKQVGPVYANGEWGYDNSNADTTFLQIQTAILQRTGAQIAELSSEYTATRNSSYLRARSGVLPSGVALTSSRPEAVYFSNPTLQPATPPDNYTGKLLDPATGDTVAAGLYTPDELAVFMRYTMGQHLIAKGFVLALEPPFEDEAPLNIRHEWELTNKGAKSKFIVTLLPDVASEWIVELYSEWGDTESFIRDLGFTKTTIEPEVSPGGSQRTFVADKEPARFRWPRTGRSVPPRLYVHGFETEWAWENMRALGAIFRHVDKDGAIIDPHIVIDGVDVITIDGSTGNYDSQAGTPYLHVKRRDQMNANSGKVEEEKYIPHKAVNDDAGAQKEQKIYRAPAFPKTTLNLMLLQLLLGGSGAVDPAHVNDPTYGRGWQGCGLNIPPRFIDIAAFEQLDDDQPEFRDNWMIHPGDTMRSVLDEEIKMTQQIVASGLGIIYPFRMQQELESDIGTAHVIDATNIVTNLESGVGFNRSENRIVNRIKIEGNYDNAIRKSLTTFNNLRGESAGTWGEKEPVQIEARGLRSVGEQASEARALAQSMFGAFGSPYALYELDLANFDAWTWRIGDQVSVTYPAFPKEREAGAGVESLKGTIVAKTDYYMGSQEGSGAKFCRVTIASRGYNGKRSSTWVPSARGISTPDSGTTWVIRDFQYARDSANAPLDASFFTAGMSVLVAEVGETQSPQQTTLTNVTVQAGNLSEFELALAYDTGVEVIFWFSNYLAVAEEQTRHVYLSAGNGTLIRSAAPLELHPAFQMV